MGIEQRMVIDAISTTPDRHCRSNGCRRTDRSKSLMGRALSFAMLCGSLASSAVITIAAPTEVPLKDSWGYEIAGTQDVREKRIPKLLPNDELLRRSVVEQIRWPLRNSRPKEAAPGFVVEGTDFEALKRMRDVLANHVKQPDSFSPDRPLSLAFFCYSSAPDLKIDHVERDGQVITLKFHFVSRSSLDSFPHFALIPLGRLAPGEYEVKIQQLPLEEGDPLAGADPLTDDLVKRSVCQPFKFVVRK